jgi:hypothetical protein
LKDGGEKVEIFVWITLIMVLALMWLAAYSLKTISFASAGSAVAAWLSIVITVVLAIVATVKIAVILTKK